jgi:hypothetical protein
MVAVLLVVIAAQLVKRREDPDVGRLRAGLEQLPLSEAEKEEVVDAYKHRNDDLGPVDVTDTVLRGARHYRVPASGRLRIGLSYGEGAWYLYDRRWLAHWQPNEDPAMQALNASFRRAGGVAESGGVVAVTACQDGDDPLDIRLRDRAPGPPRTGKATDVELDIPSGDAVIQGNGDGSAQAVVAMPPGRYRARISVTSAKDCGAQRFGLDLWPR